MELTARESPFTTFCEGPANVEKGYDLFLLFHERNYRRRMPADRDARILVVSSGVGYFQNALKKWGYGRVEGVDSDERKVAAAREKGFQSTCADCFDFLAAVEEGYDLIFAEQELNHLTRDEVVVFLERCLHALNEGGALVVNAANCANPLIATEYTGNNIDHYTAFTENSARQYFRIAGFENVEVFPHDFYVLKHNPLNHVAKALTGCIHFTLKILFRMYGKSNSIFTKRFGVMAWKR